MDTQCHKKIESKPQKSTSETNAAKDDNDDKEKIKKYKTHVYKCNITDTWEKSVVKSVRMTV